MFYDAGKIFTGLAVFVVGATFPFWYAAAAGKTGQLPELERPAGATSCVLPVQEMKADHMKLLNTWRDQVVRQGDRAPVTVDGRAYPRSLSMGCLECHEDKAQFCDRCHDYTGVSPYCWDCHVEGEE